MHIFVDESGTFAKTPEVGSFCVVGAVAVPESSMRKLVLALERFKIRHGFSRSDEVKLRDLKESAYRQWLEELSTIDVIALAVATDSSFNSSAGAHKEIQASKIEEQVPMMIFDAGKAMVQDLATRLRSISDQNYSELLARLHLVKDVFQLSTLYYSQRKPGALASFKWKFDGKDIRENDFERIFRDLAPVMLQTMSLEDGGFKKVQGGNYSHFDRSFRLDGDASWLLGPGASDGVKPELSSIGKMWKSDLAFVRSHEHPGVQVADLLVSGIGRALRGGFSDNEGVATAIGRCMVQRWHDSPGLSLFALDSGTGDKRVGRSAARVVRLMHAQSKKLIV